MQNIAERLKIVRGSRSQHEFAKVIGLKQTTYGQYERGVTSPSIEAVSLICRNFGINLRWLMFGEGEMYDNEVDVPGVQGDVNTLREDVIKMKNDIQKKDSLIEDYIEQLNIMHRSLDICTKEKEILLKEYFSFLLNQMQYVQDIFVLYMVAIKIEGEKPADQKIKRLVQAIKDFWEKVEVYNSDVRNSLERLKKAHNDLCR